MKRSAVMMLSLMCVGGIIALLVQGPAAGMTYTMAQVHAMVARHPQRWIGQTILVRGRIVQVTYQLSGARLMSTAHAVGQSAILVAPARLKHAPVPVFAPTLSLLGVWTMIPVPMPCYAANPACAIPSITGQLPGTSLHVLLASDNYPISGLGPTLQVRLDPTPSFLAFLHHILLLARLLPLQRLQWSGAAVYRLHILRNLATPCHSLLPCDDAVLIGGML